MLLTEEQQSVQEMARRFAQERLAPGSERWDREHEYPAEAIREMAELGFFGMLVPEDWDGNASGYLSYAVALEEIAAGNGACSTIMSVHNSVACMPILKFGTDEQKERFLRRWRAASISAACADRAAGRLGRQQPAHPRAP